MASLRYLSVAGNALSGALDAGLGGLSSAALAYLDVSGNALSGLLPAGLLRLTAGFNISAAGPISGFAYSAATFEQIFSAVMTPPPAFAFPPAQRPPPPPPAANGSSYRIPCSGCADCPCPANPTPGYPFGNGTCAATIAGGQLHLLRLRRRSDGVEAVRHAAG
jgi:hypothetical protein